MYAYEERKKTVRKAWPPSPHACLYTCIPAGLHATYHSYVYTYICIYLYAIERKKRKKGASYNSGMWEEEEDLTDKGRVGKGRHGQEGRQMGSNPSDRAGRRAWAGSDGLGLVGPSLSLLYSLRRHGAGGGRRLWKEKEKLISPSVSVSKRHACLKNSLTSSTLYLGKRGECSTKKWHFCLL